MGTVSSTRRQGILPCGTRCECGVVSFVLPVREFGQEPGARAELDERVGYNRVVEREVVDQVKLACEDHDLQKRVSSLWGRRWGSSRRAFKQNGEPLEVNKRSAGREVMASD